MLEDRTVPSTVSAITSNFNGTSIPAGDTVWFSSVAKVQGVGSSPVTIHLTNQTITFAAAGTQYNLSVPDAVVILSPTATSASTTFDAASNSWVTVAPSQPGGNVFLGGLAFQVTGGLPGGINPVTWQAQFSSDTAGVTVNWQWAAAVYRNFSPDYTALGVKPVDANNLSAYRNSDHAGTPETFKTWVTGGARGGGGSNFTGSYSATKMVVPSVVGTAPASISGYVYEDDNDNGIKEDNEFGIGGVVITLTGVDDQGNAVTLTTTTDASGFYSFTGLRPGSYSLVKSPVVGYVDGLSTPGTVNGTTDGSTLQNGVQVANYIGQISLGAGDNGINYNFAELVFATT